MKENSRIEAHADLPCGPKHSHLAVAHPPEVAHEPEEPHEGHEDTRAIQGAVGPGDETGSDERPSHHGVAQAAGEPRVGGEPRLGGRPQDQCNDGRRYEYCLPPHGPFRFTISAPIAVLLRSAFAMKPRVFDLL